MAEDVSFEVTIADGETVIEIAGDRDAAVVVESAGGERIYLPPEDFERPSGSKNDSPYQSARDDSPYQSADETSPYRPAEQSDSPYRSAEHSDSPYQSAQVQAPEEGLRPTRDGFVIRHPEPATDVRLLR